MRSWLVIFAILIVLAVLILALSGCATAESQARLQALEAQLNAARDRLTLAQQSPATPDGAETSALREEVARLAGAVSEAENQVARERQESLDTTLGTVGGFAQHLAPLLGYILPGGAGLLAFVGNLLTRRPNAS